MRQHHGRNPSSAGFCTKLPIIPCYAARESAKQPCCGTTLATSIPTDSARRRSLADIRHRTPDLRPVIIRWTERRELAVTSSQDDLVRGDANAEADRPGDLYGALK